jgi:hypothetical protein
MSSDPDGGRREAYLAVISESVAKLEGMAAEFPPGVLASYTWLVEDLGFVVQQPPPDVTPSDVLPLLGSWVNRLDEKARKSLLSPDPPTRMP